MQIENYLETIKKDRSKKFIRLAIEMGVVFEVLSEEFNLLKATFQGKQHILYKETLHLNRLPSTSFTKNKEITKILLRDAGLNVPTGIYAKKYTEALKIMEASAVSYPVVVKPVDAAKGFGVTVGVKNNLELKEALKKLDAFIKTGVMKCSGSFLIERMKEGNDFRVLVLNNKTIACAQRIPANLTGDGKSSLRELIENFNASRPKEYALNIDGDLMKMLDDYGLDLDSLVENNKNVVLRKNANISSGGQAIDKTLVISERFKKISSQAAAALGLNYGGVDIMTEDITSEDPAQKYFIIEINGAPDYDIHEKPLVTGHGVDITKILVEEFLK